MTFNFKEHAMEKEDIDFIIYLICTYFGQTEEKIRKNSSDKKTSLTRKYIYYVLHEDFNVSPRDISLNLHKSENTIVKNNEEMNFLIRQEPFNEYEKTHDEILEMLKSQGLEI